MSKRVLNVGGGSKRIKLPPHYEGYEHVLLDIDPVGEPDILLDAKRLQTLPFESYDAVFSSHTLEHFYEHELPVVLRGMLHVVKPDGFVEIRVPDAAGVVDLMARDGRDFDFVLYQSGSGPITIGDVLWGSSKHTAYQPHPFMTHKTGFSVRLLDVALHLIGFSLVAVQQLTFEIRALAFKQEPSAELKALLGVEHGE